MPVSGPGTVFGSNAYLLRNKRGGNNIIAHRTNGHTDAYSLLPGSIGPGCLAGSIWAVYQLALHTKRAEEVFLPGPCTVIYRNIDRCFCLSGSCIYR